MIGLLKIHLFPDETFYNVNIFIFTQSIDRKIDILRPKNYKEYYYTFWNLIKRRPIVFLVEYSELFKYELIKEE